MNSKMLVPYLLAYFPFLVAALAFVSIVVPSRMKTRARAIWAMVLLFAASRSLVFESFGGSLFTPNFPEAVVWLWYFACSALYILLGLRIFWWTPHGRTTVMPALAVLIAAWGVWEGFRPPALREIEVSFKNLPAELDGYRLLQITDVHCSSAARKWRTQAIVDLANAAKPDLVCLTGDYADGYVDERADDLKPLLGLKATDGVWSVTGNHEYYQDGRKWRQWERDNGFNYLVNDCVHPRPRLALAGVNDPIALPCGPDVPPNVTSAFRESDTNDFRILMAHRPLGFTMNAQQDGVDFQLSGHTHGGVMPGLAQIVARMNGGFVRGFYEEGDARLYVSPGAGLWAGFPIRFFNRSEITLFVLRCGKDKPLSEKGR